MNKLSWIIYGFDVLSNVKSAVGFVSFLTGSLSAIGGVIALISITSSLTKEDSENGKALLGQCKKLFVIFLTLITINAFIPTHKTLILIASSQYGEMFLNNPKINEIVDPSIDLLKDWIAKEKNKLEMENSK